MNKDTWNSLSFFEQMSNIDGDVERMIRAHEKFKSNSSKEDNGYYYLEQIKKMIFEDVLLKNAYMTLLENALRYKIYRENGFLVENATERYIHFRKLYPEICSSVKQQYIATYLGIAPESLSRIRKNMKETENDLNSDLLK